MAKLGLEARMTIHELARRGVSGRQIAGTVEVTEGAVRYHRRRRATGAVDGRSRQAFLASGWHGQMADWPAACEAAQEAVNLVVLPRGWRRNPAISSACGRCSPTCTRGFRSPGCGRVGGLKPRRGQYGVPD